MISFSRNSKRNNKKANAKKAGNAKKKFMRKKICPFCAERRQMYDYKEVERLEKFLSEKGKIMPRKMSGMCARHQRGLATVIKRSRHAGLLYFVSPR